MKTLPETKKRGRPRKHQDAAGRLQHFRRRKLADGRRLDIYLPSESSWRLTALSEAWGCSRGKAIERLLLEADERYTGILFSETG